LLLNELISGFGPRKLKISDFFFGDPGNFSIF